MYNVLNSEPRNRKPFNVGINTDTFAFKHIKTNAVCKMNKMCFHDYSSFD